MARGHHGRMRTRAWGGELLKVRYQGMPVGDLNFSLRAACHPDSGASLGTLHKVIPKIERASVYSLLAMEKRGANVYEIERAARQLQGTIEELEANSQSSRTVLYPLFIFYQRIGRTMADIRRRSGKPASRSEQLQADIIRIAGERSTPGAEQALLALIKLAKREAIKKYLEGDPSKSFTAPLEETTAFLERLKRASPPGLSKSNRNLIEKGILSIDELVSPIAMASRIESVRTRRQAIDNAIRRAQTLDEVNSAESKIWEAGFEKGVDDQAIEALWRRANRKRKIVSAKIVEGLPQPRETRYEKMPGHVFFGIGTGNRPVWLQLRKLEAYLSKVPEKKQLDALAEFVIPLGGKKVSLGHLAKNAIYAAQKEYGERNGGRKANIMALLRILEEKGKPISG
ncbi:MAG: hypothetical protein V1493_04435 [Candidatus Diapherotrites archaeon]